MPETTTRITVGGKPLLDADLIRIQSVDLTETMGSQTQVGIVTSVDVDNASQWTSPLDSLVKAFAPFEIRLKRENAELRVPARAMSASWSLAAGGQSTLTIAGFDASADLDRTEREQTDGATMSDSAVARKIFQANHLGVDVDDTLATARAPYARTTDWKYLQTLAERNGFELFVEQRGDNLTGVFKKLNPLTGLGTPTPPQTLALGYGTDGGSANVEIQLAASQNVQFTTPIKGSDGRQTTDNPGTGNAMGTQSLGGAVTVLRNRQDLNGKLQPADAARVMAERSAFAATLSVTLSSPDMPLLRARRTVQVRGLGNTISGLWLVRSVRHSITPGGHTQAVTLVRNALGDNQTSGGALAGAVAEVASA